MSEDAVKEEVDKVAEVIVDDGENRKVQPEEIAKEVKKTEVGENDVVLEGTQPLFDQQSVNSIVQGRVKKLNAKLSDATDQVSTKDTELVQSQEKYKILQIAYDQLRDNVPAKVVEPNPDDFDLGYEDPAFRQKQQEFTKVKIQEEVQRQVTQSTQSQADNNAVRAKSQKLERRQNQHYVRADEMGVKDYDATEDKAIAILGMERTNQLIEHFDEAHKLLYYFGKNEAAANNFKSVIDNDLLKGVAEIGRLQASLVVKPRTSNVPDPDNELVGGNTPGENKDKKLNKLLDEAASTGDLKKALAYQRELRSLGKS